MNRLPMIRTTDPYSTDRPRVRIVSAVSDVSEKKNPLQLSVTVRQKCVTVRENLSLFSVLVVAILYTGLPSGSTFVLTGRNRTLRNVITC